MLVELNNSSIKITFKARFCLKEYELIEYIINFENKKNDDWSSMKHKKVKETLFEHCERYINKRIDTIQNILKELQESKSNESKSSMGDKYETGRAMIQIEENKNKAQLSQAYDVKRVLSKIELEKQSDSVAIGSLVKTNNGMYFLSIGVGKVEVDTLAVFCIAINSPIALQMRNKKIGDKISFNRNEIVIEGIF